MFEITGDDIARLTDADLRTLVARLAMSELRAGGGRLSAVTAGGHQDAPDGGVDVRVDLAELHDRADFVPRAKTIFQVKRPDMPASEIDREMRPGGALRAAIADLAAQGGAYIIVSAQGSVADIALTARRDAMRAAVDGDPNGSALAVDFYDRARVATWVNTYPGVAAWVRERCGRRLAGWRAIGAWRDVQTAVDAGYLTDGTLSLIDQRQGRRVLQITEGISALRDILSIERGCIRLIGLSGTGKTRFVEALFEEYVGEGPLDPGLAVYADYVEPTDPTARDMAAALVDGGERAILIVDNCNAVTHGQLVEIAQRPGSRLSLLTVEYDIRDDEPEGTEVFRLQQADSDLVATWLERDFPHVSQLDRGRIARFSDGNFRVARALAGTVRPGESLAHLRSEALFERIFQQRNTPNDTLLRDAQLLAVLYSFDVTEGDEGELARLAAFGGRTPQALHESTAALQTRGVLQARGRWRAVLPQAIANRLAAGLLGRLTPGALDAFMAGLPERMARSASRRIGYLHDVPQAVAAAQRWVAPDGVLGDLVVPGRLSLLVNLAPAAPEAVLARLEARLAEGAFVPAPRGLGRGDWISLLKALAYDAPLFDRAALVLARLVAQEAPDENYDSGRSAFQELFQLYLSGTEATPGQRRAFIAGLLENTEEPMGRVTRIALDALMQTDHFSATNNLDFGARPRDFGWQPKLRGEETEWYLEGVALIRRAVADLDVQKEILAGGLRGLWRREAYRAEIERVAEVFLADGGWREGWAALRTVMAFDCEDMPETVRLQTETLIARLAPVDLAEQARAYVLVSAPGSWDADSEEDFQASWARGDERARDIGRRMAREPEALADFLPAVLRSRDYADRTGPFAEGLVEGGADLAGLWTALLTAMEATPPAERNLSIIGGVIRAVVAVHPDVATTWLDALAIEPDRTAAYAQFQASAGLDERGVDRVLAVAARSESATALRAIGGADTARLDEPGLLRLLGGITAFEGGVPIGLDLLFTRVRGGAAAPALSAGLVDVARGLMARLEVEDIDDLTDVRLRILAPHCLAGEEAEGAARAVCQAIHAAFAGPRGYRRRGYGLVDLLFNLQPVAALDVLVGGSERQASPLFNDRLGRRDFVDRVEMPVLLDWARRDPAFRFGRLAEVMPLFRVDPGSDTPSLSTQFVEVLEAAPDKTAFLGEPHERLHPRSGWSGTLPHVLDRRRALLADLPNHPDIDAWRQCASAEVDDWIRHEQARQANSEESFE